MRQYDPHPDCRRTIAAGPRPERCDGNLRLHLALAGAEGRAPPRLSNQMAKSHSFAVTGPVPPASSTRRPSIIAGGSGPRLAMVRFRTRLPSRQLSRRSTAGADRPFGTTSTNMADSNHIKSGRRKPHVWTHLALRKPGLMPTKPGQTVDRQRKLRPSSDDCDLRLVDTSITSSRGQRGSSAGESVEDVIMRKMGRIGGGVSHKKTHRFNGGLAGCYHTGRCFVSPSSQGQNHGRRT